jgi:hypothetical protein
MYRVEMAAWNPEQNCVAIPINNLPSQEYVHLLGEPGPPIWPSLKSKLVYVAAAVSTAFPIG